MAQENIYENTVASKAEEPVLKQPPPKRTLPVVTALALLSVLLAVSLIAVAVLYVQKDKKLLELEGVVEEIRTSQRLSNISYGSEEAWDNVHLLQNISAVFSVMRAELEKATVSKTAAQDRYRPPTQLYGQLLVDVDHRAVLEDLEIPRENTSVGKLLELVSTGWRFYGKNFYFFSEEAKPWQDAEQACLSQGAHLTSITSQQELQYLVRQANGQTFWIGLTDQQEEGTWTWTDGTKYNNQISFWSRGQPDNWSGAPEHQEDCVHVSKEWNDFSCGHSYKWFCKKSSP